jgi:polyribonucleotide nucleotidyltransferase
VKKLESDIVRKAILKDGQRIDGRRVDQVARSKRSSASCPALTVRPVHSWRDAGDLHHHAGHKGRRADDRRAEGLSYSNFMLHYNFPALFGR